MATVTHPAPARRRGLLTPLSDVFVEIGDVTLFALQVLLGSFSPPRRAGLSAIFFYVGVRSVPVVVVTGAFIGMVLAAHCDAPVAQICTARVLRTVGHES